MPDLIRARISSTHIDLDNDRMTVEALRGMAEQCRDRYIPVLWNHDIRHPPLGRVVAAEVVPLEDGEFALETESEYWVDSDNPEQIQSDGRKLVVDVSDHHGFAVTYDRGLSDVASLEVIGAIAAIGGEGDPVRTEKKALDPVATLVLTSGLFVVGAIATGFLGQIGADGYVALKSRLRELSGRHGYLLDFHFCVRSRAAEFEAHVVIDTPTPLAVDQLFDSEFKDLDPLIEDLVDLYPDVSKVFVFWKDGSMSVGYALRSDAYPVMVDWRVVGKKDRDTDPS